MNSINKCFSGLSLAVLAALVSLSVHLVAHAASVEIMPLSEIKPGMTGYCLTTLKGFEPERLEIQILGIAPGMMPQRAGIIFTGTDDTFKRFGILAGMSGSPCYIDDKLIGALSYGWFAEKEPIGGITPIELMLAVLDAPSVSQSRGGSGGLLAAQAAGLEPYLDEQGRFRMPLKLPSLGEMLHKNSGFEIPEAAVAGDPMFSRFAGAKLTPIPLSYTSSFAGLDSLLAEEGGVASVHTSSPKPVSIDPEQLRPGCPLGDALVTGDLDWSGMGTLTYRDGDTILAYGHSSFGGGSVSYPMCSGIVHTGFPSYFYSHKISSGSQPLGVITQDRDPAVAGKIGAAPDMLPADVWLTDADSGKTRKLHFDVIRDRFFSPYLLALVADYSIAAHQHEWGPITVDWEITVPVKDRGQIELTDSYSEFKYGFG